MKRLVILLTVLVLTPVTALSQTHAASAPIAITTCQLMKQHSQMGLGNLFINGKAYNFFKVDFVNHGAETAERIVFQIDFEKSRYVIGDNGSFAPGVSISHIFRDHGKDVTAGARPAGEDPKTTVCNALSVKFKDGTTWSAH